jgi:predicted nucleotidyltransferase
MSTALNPKLLEQIQQFCEHWQIIELAIFGSALRDAFGPESDVDILATFSPDAEWGLLDHVQMTTDLSAIFEREVDLITRRGLEHSNNWIRRDEILNTSQVIYDQDKIIYGP